MRMKILQIRLSDEEMEAVKKSSSLLRMSASEWARHKFGLIEEPLNMGEQSTKIIKPRKFQPCPKHSKKNAK